MSKLDEQAWLVVVAAQQFVKTGDRSRLEQFALADLRQAERELGRRDAAPATVPIAEALAFVQGKLAA